MTEMKRTPDDIWAEDLFSRREEAEQLIAYIESVAARPVKREDKCAYTIAVDARYGEGKSFFLRRLAEQLSINHPVAFVDAWADDLTDEPLTALAATLKAALEPLISHPDIGRHVSDFVAKSGKVAKIVGWGLLRRGAGLLLTGKAVEAAEGVLEGLGEDVKDAVNDGLADVGKGTIDDGAAALEVVGSHALMEQRIAAFEEGKAAVAQLKESLAALVASLDGKSLHAPIVIVIDELDRCRPTYAIKLLEEIKHLFDVPGLVFVLAIHSDQLAHSVSGAYGSTFDGRAYLRRFIDRQYNLTEPRLAPLVKQLFDQAGLGKTAFAWPELVLSGRSDLEPSAPEFIAEYMRVYGMGARDAFALIDSLQTSAMLVGTRKLQLHYLLPLAIAIAQGHRPGTIPEPVMSSQWAYVPYWTSRSPDPTEVTLSQMTAELGEAAQLHRRDLDEKITRGANEGASQDGMYAARFMRNAEENGDGVFPFWSPKGYPRLLAAVSRFSNPKLEDKHPLGSPNDPIVPA